MDYEINVSFEGKHFFRTCTMSETGAKEVYARLCATLSGSDGYAITLSRAPLRTWTVEACRASYVETERERLARLRDA